MKLMTVWNAYRDVSHDIQVLIAERAELHDANEHSQQLMLRLRQQTSFGRRITERIKRCDDLYEWAIREIDEYEEEMKHTNWEGDC